MGKLTPPTVIRVRSDEAICTLNQVIEAQKRLGDAFRAIAGESKVITQKRRPRLCTQCGAPMHGEICEYCGTEY